MRTSLGRLLQALQTGLLDRLDLLADDCEPGQVAADFVEGIRWDWSALWRGQGLNPLWGVTQLWLEAADPKASQDSLHPVDKPGALADQGLPLAAWALGVLLVQRWDCHHAAVLGLAAQPAQKGTLEQLGVEPIRLGPPVLARDGDAVWMDHIGFDVAGSQPARQPKAVATGLISDGDARDRAPSFGRFVLPAAQQAEQRRLIGTDLLKRMAADPWHDRSHKPARLAHLDDGDEGAGLIEGEEGSAQIIVLRHERLQGWFDQRGCFTLAGLHSFSPRPWPRLCAGAARWAAVGLWTRHT